MSSCGTGTSCDSIAPRSDICGTCGSRGLLVDPITLKALFTADALRRGVPAHPRFCPAEECVVVYFDHKASLVFTEEDLTVRVHAKHRHDDDVPVCYCFEHSPGTVRREIELRGSSTASKTITAEVKAGHCACEVKNPKGTCCLGDVAQTEREVKRWLEEKEQLPAKSI